MPRLSRLLPLPLSLRLALLAVWLAIPAACAPIVAALPAVIAAVCDGMMVLDTIEKFVDHYFVGRPDPAKQQQVAIVLARTRGALNAALRTAEGAEKLDQAKIDEAFVAFRGAYVELLALVGPLGVHTAGTAFSASSGVLTVPDPLALKLKVR